MVSGGDTGGPYFDNHMITYACDAANNFATTDGPLVCTCDTSNAATPMWTCGGVNFLTTCRKSKIALYNAQVCFWKGLVINVAG